MGSRNWQWAVGLAFSTAIPVLAACGGDGEASGAGGSTTGSTTTGSTTTGEGGSKKVDSTHYCDEWAAQCPAEAGSDYSWCATDCEKGQSFEQEDCWSTYCSVEIGRCYTDGAQTADNEAVIACAKAHGWEK